MGHVVKPFSPSVVSAQAVASAAAGRTQRILFVRRGDPTSSPTGGTRAVRNGRGRAQTRPDVTHACVVPAPLHASWAPCIAEPGGPRTWSARAAGQRPAEHQPERGSNGRGGKHRSRYRVPRVSEPSEAKERRDTATEAREQATETDERGREHLGRKAAVPDREGSGRPRRATRATRESEATSQNSDQCMPPKQRSNEPEVREVRAMRATEQRAAKGHCKQCEMPPNDRHNCNNYAVGGQRTTTPSIASTAKQSTPQQCMPRQCLP